MFTEWTQTIRLNWHFIRNQMEGILRLISFITQRICAVGHFLESFVTLSINHISRHVYLVSVSKGLMIIVDGFVITTRIWIKWNDWEVHWECDGPSLVQNQNPADSLTFLFIWIVDLTLPFVVVAINPWLLSPGLRF